MLVITVEDLTISKVLLYKLHVDCRTCLKYVRMRRYHLSRLLSVCSIRFQSKSLKIKSDIISN